MADALSAGSPLRLSPPSFVDNRHGGSVTRDPHQRFTRTPNSSSFSFVRRHGNNHGGETFTLRW